MKKILVTTLFYIGFVGAASYELTNNTDQVIKGEWIEIGIPAENTQGRGQFELHPSQSVTIQSNLLNMVKVTVFGLDTAQGPEAVRPYSANLTAGTRGCIKVKRSFLTGSTYTTTIDVIWSTASCN